MTLRREVLARCEQEECAKRITTGRQVYPQTFVVAMGDDSDLDLWLDGPYLRAVVSEREASQARLQMAVRSALSGEWDSSGLTLSSLTRRRQGADVRVLNFRLCMLPEASRYGCLTISRTVLDVHIIARGRSSRRHCHARLCFTCAHMKPL